MSDVIWADGVLCGFRGGASMIYDLYDEPYKLHGPCSICSSSELCVFVRRTLC